MKKIWFKTFTILMIIFTLTNCESETEGSNFDSQLNEKKIESLYSLKELSSKVQSTVTISCSGGCDCRVSGTSGPNGPIETHCTCDDCVMDITFEKSSDKTVNNEKLMNTILNLELYKVAMDDLKSYARDQYDIDITGLNKIEFNMKNNHMLFILFFKDKEGNQCSVLYSAAGSNELNKVAKKIRIDCIGTCECLEIYNFETSSASCSCSDCSMIVEEL